MSELAVKHGMRLPRKRRRMREGLRHSCVRRRKIW